MIARGIGRIVAAACLGASSLGAQSDTVPSPGAALGQRVLVVTHHGKWHVGILIDGDSANLGILLDGRRDTTRLARSNVTDMLVSTGKRDFAAAGATFGVFSGMFAGAAIALAHAPACNQNAFLGGLTCSGNTIDKAGRGFAGGVIGAAVGGVVGGFLGWLVKTDRWERLPRKR